MAPGNALAPAGPQKHRACDECRFRKIACSKEPDGCLRCQKEGIKCVYSPQKPMGRPRKRRHAEPPAQPAGPASAPAPVPVSVAASPVAQPASSLGSASAPSLAPSLAPAPAPVPAQDSSLLLPAMGNQAAASPAYVDASFHPIQHQNAAAHHYNHHEQPLLPTDYASDFSSQHVVSDMSYLDLLPDYDTGGSNLFGMDDDVLFAQGLFDGVAIPPMNMSQAELFENISFDETDPSSVTMSKDLNDSLQRYMVSQYSDPPAPSESSPSASAHSTYLESLDPTTVESTPALENQKPHPIASCDCLPSLFGALGSLNRLPSDVIPAMRVARHATRIAHDTLNCCQCLGYIYDPSKPVPMSRFQGMMCLGALVPSACNAYSAILEMVDRDTERAKQEFRLLYFSFKEVGGIWANIIDETTSTNADCARLKSYNNKYLDPDLWRTTIRAILKVEVYGFDQQTASVPDSDCTKSPYMHLHRGLKDVVTLLDEQNAKRHDMADSLMQSGHMFPHSPSYLLFPSPPKPCPPEDRHCVRMLDVARTALSNLVIT